MPSPVFDREREPKEFLPFIEAVEGARSRSIDAFTKHMVAGLVQNEGYAVATLAHHGNAPDLAAHRGKNRAGRGHGLFETGRLGQIVMTAAALRNKRAVGGDVATLRRQLKHLAILAEGGVDIRVVPFRYVPPLLDEQADYTCPEDVYRVVTDEEVHFFGQDCLDEIPASTDDPAKAETVRERVDRFEYWYERAVGGEAAIREIRDSYDALWPTR